MMLAYSPSMESSAWLLDAPFLRLFMVCLGVKGEKKEVSTAGSFLMLFGSGWMKSAKVELHQENSQEQTTYFEKAVKIARRQAIAEQALDIGSNDLEVH